MQSLFSQGEIYTQRIQLGILKILESLLQTKEIGFKRLGIDNTSYPDFETTIKTAEFAAFTQEPHTLTKQTKCLLKINSSSLLIQTKRYFIFILFFLRIIRKLSGNFHALLLKTSTGVCTPWLCHLISFRYLYK